MCVLSTTHACEWQNANSGGHNLNESATMESATMLLSVSIDAWHNINSGHSESKDTLPITIIIIIIIIRFRNMIVCRSTTPKSHNTSDARALF